LTPKSGGEPIVLKYIDSDGEGGIDPSITEGTLMQIKPIFVK